MPGLVEALAGAFPGAHPLRCLFAMLLAFLPSGALACGNSFGKLDNHNRIWEAVLGITFDNPVVKASSMNDRCWVEDSIEMAALKRIWRNGPPRSPAEIYRVPGIRIEPDYATYPDEREAYENGRHSPMGVDLLRIIVGPASGATREALRRQLEQRNMRSPDGKAGKVENTTGAKTIGGIEMELFSSRIERPGLNSDFHASAAMFIAPGNPDLLVVFLGGANFETDRVGGIDLEETLHQAVRDIEKVDPEEARCPFDYAGLSGLNPVLAPLGLTFDSGEISADDMGRACWSGISTDETVAEVLMDGGDPEGVATLTEVISRTPQGVDTGLYALKVSVVVWDGWLENRDALIAGGLLRPPAGEKEKLEHLHSVIEIAGLEADLFTAHVDAPFLKQDRYRSGIVLRSPARTSLAVMIRGAPGTGYARIGGQRVEKTLHDALMLLRPVQAE